MMLLFLLMWQNHCSVIDIHMKLLCIRVVRLCFPYKYKWILKSYLEMELAVDSLPFCIHHFESVTSISIHVLIAIRNAAIGKQEADLMGGLRTQGDEIPEHVGVLDSKNVAQFLVSYPSALVIDWY